MYIILIVFDLHENAFMHLCFYINIVLCVYAFMYLHFYV